MTDLLIKQANSPMEKAAQLVELETLQKQIKAKIDEYKKDLLEVTQTLDVLQLKTGEYTITRAKRITPTVTDFYTLKKSLEKEDIPYVTQEVFGDQMKLVFKQLAEAHRELKGLEIAETEYIMIRLATKKGGEIK